MRIDIKEARRLEDEGRIGRKKGDGEIQVFVDGMRVPFCYLADEEQGIAEGFAPNAEGRKHVDPETREPVIARYEGKVEVRFATRTRDYSPRRDEQA